MSRRHAYFRDIKKKFCEVIRNHASFFPARKTRSIFSWPRRIQLHLRRRALPPHLHTPQMDRMTPSQVNNFSNLGDEPCPLVLHTGISPSSSQNFKKYHGNKDASLLSPRPVIC